MLPTVLAELPAVTDTLVAVQDVDSVGLVSTNRSPQLEACPAMATCVGVTSTLSAPLSGGAPDARFVRLS